MCGRNGLYRSGNGITTATLCSTWHKKSEKACKSKALPRVRAVCVVCGLDEGSVVVECTYGDMNLLVCFFLIQSFIIRM